MPSGSPNEIRRNDSTYITCSYRMWLHTVDTVDSGDSRILVRGVLKVHLKYILKGIL